MKKANNKEAYDEIADEIFRLRELKQQAAVDTVTRDEQAALRSFRISSAASPQSCRNLTKFWSNAGCRKSPSGQTGTQLN